MSDSAPCNQPFTAATSTSTLEITNAQRWSILASIAGPKHWSFDKSRINGRIWDALIGEWDWQERTGTFVPANDAKAKHDHMIAVERTMKDKFRVEITKPLAEDIRDFVRERLEEKEPPHGQPDTRWSGLASIEMRRLYDVLDRMISAEPNP